MALYLLYFLFSFNLVLCTEVGLFVALRAVDGRLVKHTDAQQALVLLA